jgi:hypothetical protein
MNKENIRINSINNKYGIAPWNDNRISLLYMDVNFDYERLYNCNIRIDTNFKDELLNYDEIKSQIIEELSK